MSKLTFHIIRGGTVSLSVAALALLGCCAAVAACGSSGRTTETTAQTASKTASAAQLSGTLPAKLSSAERKQIAALVNRYYAAEAARDGAAACSLFDAAMHQSVPVDYGGANSRPFLRGKTCAVVVTKMFEHHEGVASPSDRPVAVVGMALNRKHQSNRTIIVSWRSSNGKSGKISVDREGDLWRIA